MDVKLNVLICTFGDRIYNLRPEDYPAVPGVAYIVSWQNPGELERPASWQRPDFTILTFADKGLSCNRNHALDAAVAPFAMICDDDVALSAPGLMEVIARFEQWPEVDVLLFRSDTSQTRTYPPDGYKLRQPFRGHYATSIEIALRMSAVRRVGLRFNELAGIGAPVLVAGEEELLLRDARRRGLEIRFADIRVASHPADTTAERLASSPDFIRSKGAMIAATRGYFTALTRFPLEARRAAMPYFPALAKLLQGLCYALKHRREL